MASASTRRSKQGRLIREEIGRVVSDAHHSGAYLPAGLQAARICGKYPGSGLSPNQVADAIIAAAAEAGIAVEMSRPH